MWEVVISGEHLDIDQVHASKLAQRDCRKLAVKLSKSNEKFRELGRA